MFSRSIDVYLITGFLGSGKTTFLCQLLNQAKNYPKLRYGVLLNEFGTENVDSVLFPQTSLTFMEINGGSIFCNCLHGEFIFALKRFYESTKINTLFIEASGLSNPSMIIQDLIIINKQIGDVYKLRENICLIDASLLMKLIKVITNIKAQLQVSSLVLINKIDLIDSDHLKSIEELIHQINPSVKIFKTTFGKFNLNSLNCTITYYYDLKDKRRDSRGEYFSLTLMQRVIFPKQNFLNFLESLKDSVMRAKGYVQIGEKDWYRIDIVEKKLTVNQVTKYPDQGKILIILKEMSNIKKIQQNWNILETN